MRAGAPVREGTGPDLAEVTGELFMVSQSRRWDPRLAAFRADVLELLPEAGDTVEVAIRQWTSTAVGGRGERVQERAHGGVAPLVEQLAHGAGGDVQVGGVQVFVEQDTDLLAETRRQLDAWLQGGRTDFDLPVELVGSDFQQQVWRELIRDEALRNRVMTDPHSPGRFRVNGVVRNIDAWYEAFGVKPGDALWLPPEQRVHIW